MKRLFTIAMAAIAALPAFAEYPDKSITILVPFAPRGPTDKGVGDFAEAIRKPLGNVAVVVDNAGGAGGTIGAAKAARAANDGYTLMLHHVSMATSPALYRKLPYKTLEDFEYLGLVNEVPMAVNSTKKLPVNVTRLGGFAGPLLGGFLLGGPFIATTALGLQIGRLLAPEAPRRVLALMTASFGLGQILGPIAAGWVAEWTGNFVAASIGAAVALLFAGAIAWSAGPSPKSP